MRGQLSRVTDHLARLRRQMGKPVHIGGQTYRVKGYFSNIFDHKSGHEKHLLMPLQRAMEARSGPFIDVGVNLGQTLTKVIELAPGRPYLGFEPQVGACFFVSDFLAANDLSHATVLPIGLSDENRLVAFFAEGVADTMGSTEYDASRHHLRKQMIQVRIGDDVLEEAGFSEPGIIKIDVEGAEMKVLRGLARTLERSQPILFFEVLPNFTGLPGSGPSERWRLDDLERERRNNIAAEQFRFLTDLGYGVFQIDGSGVEHKIDRFELDDLENPASDYVAQPR